MRYTKWKKIRTVALASIFMLGVMSENMYALTIDSIDIVSEEGKMTVSGTAETDEKVFLQVSAINSEKTDMENLIYVWQKQASDGSYTFEFNIEEAAGSAKNGDFKLETSDSLGNTKEKLFSFYDDDFLTGIRLALNDQVGNTVKDIAKISAIKNIIFDTETNRKAVVPAYAPFDMVYNNDYMDVFCELMSYENAMSTNTEMKNYIKKNSVIALLGMIDKNDVHKYLKLYAGDLMITSSEAYKTYIGFDDTNNTKAANRLSGFERPFKKNADFVKAFDTSVIITKLESVNGTTAYENVLVKYPQYFDLSSVTTNGYKALSSAVTVGTVKTVEDINRILNQTGNSGNGIIVEPGNTGGGSSSGGFGGSVSGGSSVSSPNVNNGTNVSLKPTEKQDGFSDLAGYEWAKESIEYLSKNGIINGYDSDTFAPADCVTRAQICKMLCIALKLNTYSENEIKFADVSPSEWYYDYIKTMNTMGIVNGVNENSFEPDTNVTREDMAVIAYRALAAINASLADEETIKFADSESISDYATKAIGALSNQKILNGDENGNFRPKATATRAEAAKFIYEICKGMDVNK